MRSLSYNAILFNDVPPEILGQICSTLGVQVSFANQPVISRFERRKILIPNGGAIIKGDETDLSLIQNAIRNRIVVNGKKVVSFHMVSFFTLCR